MHDTWCTAAHPRAVLVGRRMSHVNTSMGIMNYIRLHVVIEYIRIKRKNTAKRQEASDEIVINVIITHNPREAANRELGKARDGKKKV